jgi:hypothetical protein
MALELGTTDINGIYLGSAEVNKAYLGSNLIYDSSSAITGLPFGGIVAESSTPSTEYIGDPCILKTSGGRYFISHSFFGSGANNKTTVIRYTDNIGTNSWTTSTTFSNLVWGTLFEYDGDVYILGVSDYPFNGTIELARTTDNGATWSSLTTVLSIPPAYDGWVTTSANPIFKNGYLCKPFEVRNNVVGTFAGDHEATLVFADLTDLMNPANWSYSNFVSFDGTAFANSLIYTDTTETKLPDGTGTQTKGFLEGNIVEKSNGDLINLLRLEQTQNSNHAVYLDITWQPLDPPTSTLNSTHNFVEMPGGNVKFQVLWDATSSKHWTVASLNRARYFADNRIEQYLLSSSDDCVTWEVHSKVLGFDIDIDWETDIPALGVQYAHFIIDGNNLYIADRTANASADDWHNANLLTLTKVSNFRSIAATTYKDGCLIIDENSNRIEDVNGISIIEDQTKYFNSPFMLTADNANKTSWNLGLDFSTDPGYLRVPYERSLMLDYTTGLTIFAVVENTQDNLGLRILSFGDTGADDTQPGNWFFTTIGMGVETARGLYSDITLGNDYIIASSFDSANNHIYNYLNGVNRGDPPTKNDVTWDTDHLVMTTGYTGSYPSEMRIGNRIVGSSIGFNSLIKAIHIYPSYMNSSEIATVFTALNSTYSIY